MAAVGPEGLATAWTIKGRQVDWLGQGIAPPRGYARAGVRVQINADANRHRLPMELLWVPPLQPPSVLLDFLQTERVPVWWRWRPTPPVDDEHGGIIQLLGHFLDPVLRRWLDGAGDYR